MEATLVKEDIKEGQEAKLVKEDIKECQWDSGEEDHEEEEDALSHQELMVCLKDGLAEAVIGDPLLNNLPPGVTLEEVHSQVALEYGQAMTVNVRRLDGVVLPIVVVQTATVHQLKQAIKSHLTLKIDREGGSHCISWKYVWRSFWLVYDGVKLTDDDKPIKDYGIRNRDEITFIKRIQSKTL